MTDHESTTDIAQIDYASATILDGELRGLARTVARNVARFKELIDRAREQRVYEMLGFSSWTAYVADVIGKEMGRLDVGTRRDLVALLAGEGMSQRAIANSVGVSQKTVDRDLDQLSHGDSVVLPDKVIGLDNKERPAHPRPEPRPQPKPEPKPEPKPASTTGAKGYEWMVGRFAYLWTEAGGSYPDGYVPADDDPPELAAELLEAYVEEVGAIGVEPLGNTLPRLAYLKAGENSATLSEVYDEWDGAERAAAEREVAAKLAAQLRSALLRANELLALLERRAT